jgi:hypothetical protein
MKALFLLAATTAPTVGSLPFNPTTDCNATISLVESIADVTCALPVTVDQALSVVNQVAERHGVGPYLMAAYASEDNASSSRIWQLILVQN